MNAALMRSTICCQFTKSEGRTSSLLVTAMTAPSLSTPGVRRRRHAAVEPTENPRMTPAGSNLRSIRARAARRPLWGMERTAPPRREAVPLRRPDDMRDHVVHAGGGDGLVGD